MATSVISELTPEEKKIVEGIKKELELAIKTGKVLFGYRNTLRALHNGSAKAVVLARNIPLDMKAMILQLAAIGQVPVVFFSGTSRELGEVCRRPHIISVLVVTELGTSQINKHGKILQP